MQKCAVFWRFAMNSMPMNVNNGAVSEWDASHIRERAISISFTSIQTSEIFIIMFGFFGGGKKPLKGYKITTVERKQKYGVAADSLKMLKEKASVKLKVRVLHKYTWCIFNAIFPNRSMSA